MIYTVFVCPNHGVAGPASRATGRCGACRMEMERVEVVPREDLEATQALEGRLRDELDRLRTVADELADKLTLALRTTKSANARVNGEQALAKYREATTPVPA